MTSETASSRTLGLLAGALSVYRELRDEFSRLFKLAKSLHPEYVNFAEAQLYYYSERCQSLNVLLQAGKLWDCEILMRSMVECATRFLFVSTALPPERSSRLNEYWIDLNEIDILQQSQRSKPAARAAQGSPGHRLLDGVVLDVETEATLRAKWPKSKRTAIQQKWSFSEMVRELQKVHSNGVDLRLYDCFLHGYSLSSHLLHADRTAVSLVWDRNHRDQSTRTAMIEAHAARMIVEQVDLLFLCWRGFVFATEAQSIRPDIVKSLEELRRAAHYFHRDFDATQDAFYAQPEG